MPPEVLELLRRFQGGDGVEPLTDEELAALRTGLEAAAGELYDDGVTPDTVQSLQDIADACEAVDVAIADRAQLQESLQAEVEAAIQRIRRANEDNRSVVDGADPAENTDPPGEPAPGSEADQPAVENTGDGPVAGAETPVEQHATAEDRQTAAIQRAANMAARRPSSHAPRRQPTDRDPSHARAWLSAASRYAQGGVRINPGDEIGDYDTLSEIMAARLNSMGPKGGSALIASQFTNYPDERSLDDNPGSNNRKLDAVSSPQALTASGGICTPVAVDYSIPTFSVAERPVRAALPAFGATRGGIRYLTPPLMSTAVNASGIWTHANDANPSSPTTKALLKFGCATEVQVIVDAVTLRLEFGNLMARFSPEVVGANTQLALAAWARLAELNLTKQIVAGSTEVTWAGAGLGAAPEILSVFDVALAGMKDQNRLGDNVSLRTILPIWVKPLIRSDMARRLATDNSSANNGALNVSDGQIMQWFSARNINVTWTLDPLPAQGTGNTYTLQGFGVQAAGALLDYPAKLVFPLYPEGTWQFLDGGQLDLGVVRDSTLDATNDYETFFETFEGVAFRGIVSYKVIVPLRPTGATAGTVDTHAF